MKPGQPATLLSSRRTWTSVVVVAAVVALGDELAAVAVRHTLPVGSSRWLLPNLLLIGHGEHSNPANPLTIGRVLFQLVVMPAAVGYLLLLGPRVLRLRSAGGALLRLGLGLVLGGGVINGVEFIARGGYVTNFLALGRFPAGESVARFDIFNLADVALNLGGACGVLGLLLLLVGRIQQEAPAQDEGEAGGS